MLLPAVCPSGRLSPADIVSRRLNGSSLFVFFDTEAAIGYPTLCYKGIRLSSKIMVLPSESLALPLNFADFFSARK